MLIGLLSDTHVPEATSNLPAQLKEVFKGVDLIFHAGDTYIKRVLDELEGIAPVLAAEGDDDYPDIWYDERIKKKHVLNFDGTTIWLMHNYSPWSLPLEEKYQDPENPVGEKLPDIVVCGHTHTPSIVKNERGVLLINPGSATFPNYKRQLGTVGLLSVNSHKPKVQIVSLD